MIGCGLSILISGMTYMSCVDVALSIPALLDKDKKYKDVERNRPVGNGHITKVDSTLI